MGSRNGKATTIRDFHELTSGNRYISADLNQREGLGGKYPEIVGPSGVERADGGGLLEGNCVS